MTMNAAEHKGRVCTRLARRAVALAVAAGMLASGQVGAGAATGPALLPAAQITPGMTGIGRTVILGTRIAEFQAHVLGVLRNAGPAGDLVLFRASGAAIQGAGGLAAGMSGSPIYIGGRLAGAFSYSFAFADPSMGLFTPIEDMLKALPGRETPRSGVYPVSPFRLGGRLVRRIAFGPPNDGPAGPDTAVAVPAATPLFVSGLTPSATEALIPALGPIGLVPMAGSGQADLSPEIPLEPGSAIGVALMQGDVTAYAIGTLTYRDDTRVLAFGHPFTDMGKTDFLLTNATIFQTVRGQQRNLKVGAAGAPVGTISEDRPAGIGGTVGRLPRMFGVLVQVHDTDGGTSRRFRFQVVSSKDLTPVLAALGAQGVVERALNRSGEGTAQVGMTMYGRALPHPVVRENTFYSGSDIAARALSEVPQGLHLLFDNEFADLGPSDIELDVRVTGVRQTGTITETEMPQASALPGGTLRVRVTVRPFRESAVTRDVDLAVPSDFPDGPATLLVRAGGAAPSQAGAQGALPPSQMQGPALAQNLGDAISSFERGEKNTDVVIELVSGAQQAATSASTRDEAVRPSTRWTTPWVLTGRLQLPVMIGGGR